MDLLLKIAAEAMLSMSGELCHSGVAFVGSVRRRFLQIKQPDCPWILFLSADLQRGKARRGVTIESATGWQFWQACLARFLRQIGRENSLRLR